MADQLRNILQFTGLVVGVPSVQSHNLVVQGVAVAPDEYYPNVGGFTIAVTATTVTVTRTASATGGDVSIILKYWHTVDRIFGPHGPSQPTELTGSPFTSTPGVSSGGFDPDRTIVVAKTGGDTNSVETGLGLAGALVPAPSAANPAVVWVFPGIYAENPMTVPIGVTLKGSSIASTAIAATTATAALVTLEAGGMITEISLLNANGVGGYGLLASGAAGESISIMVQAVDCTIGIAATGGITLTCGNNRVRRMSSPITCGFHSTAGSRINVYSCMVHGLNAGALITRGFHAAAGSAVHVFSCDIHFCTSALYVDGTGELHVIGGHAHSCTYGMHIAGSGTLHASSFDQEDNTVYDLYVEAATGTYRGLGCSVRSDMLNVAAGASVVSTQLSDFEGDRANMIIGELQVGMPQFPSESVFGEGDSHVRQMSVFRNTNLAIGAWSDITAEMASATGSTADAFAGVGIGQCCYFGGLEKEFPGLKIKTTAAIVLGAGSLAWEYWNGGAWAVFYLMTADSIAPYHSYANDTFGRVNFEQVRFNHPEMTGWATSALNGITRYWVRCRQVGAITTSPTLEQVKLHTNRTEINADGTVEHFGTAIVQRIIPWHQRWTDDLSGASPTNGALQLVNGITITPIDNRFNDNALDGFGGIQTLPIGLDTSRPVTITWGWVPRANGAPSLVEFQIRQGLVRVGDTIDGSVGSALQAQTVSVGVADDDILKESSFTLRPYLAVPGNKSAWALFRDATGGTPDTFAGSIDIVDVRFNGYFWK